MKAGCSTVLGYRFELTAGLCGSHGSHAAGRSGFSLYLFEKNLDAREVEKVVCTEFYKQLFTSSDVSQGHHLQRLRLSVVSSRLGGFSPKLYIRFSGTQSSVLHALLISWQTTGGHWCNALHIAKPKTAIPNASALYY